MSYTRWWSGPDPCTETSAWSLLSILVHTLPKTQTFFTAENSGPCVALCAWQGKTANISAQHSQPSIQSWIHSQLSLDEAQPAIAVKNWSKNCSTLVASRWPDPKPNQHLNTKKPISSQLIRDLFHQCIRDEGLEGVFHCGFQLHQRSRGLGWLRWCHSMVFSEPRWLVLFLLHCHVPPKRKHLEYGQYMDNIFSVLDSTRKTVAMSQESGFRWGDTGDTLTRHVTPVTPIRITLAPMAKCNSSTVDMEFWRFANEPWMLLGGIWRHVTLTSKGIFWVNPPKSIDLDMLQLEWFIQPGSDFVQNSLSKKFFLFTVRVF